MRVGIPPIPVAKLQIRDYIYVYAIPKNIALAKPSTFLSP